MRGINPISTEARGQLRRWKQAASRRWTTFNRAFKGSAKDAQDLALRGSIDGRTRAFQKLRRRFAGTAVLEGVRLDRNPVAVWWVLYPRIAVTVETEDPGLRQDCVVVNYALTGAGGMYDGLGPLRCRTMRSVASCNAIQRLVWTT